jgi:NTP pyrophosphohydrolases including oxidative damage repair enzymes
MDKMNGDWTIKNREKKFENDFFSVFEDEVTRPDGRPGKYATIRFKPGVAVLPVDPDGFIYLTCQFRYALGCKNIEAICGAIDGDEPLEAAKRETKEELGIEADDWTSLGKIQTDTSITNSTTHLFLARKLTFGQPRREPTEEIETVRMALSEALEKVINGEITNGPTCMLILKASCPP